MAAKQLTSPRAAVRGVPVFMYHDLCVASSAQERYTASLTAFREHLSWLRDTGFTVAPLTGLDASVSRSVVLTFDDGLASGYELALPVLLNHQMSATFFVSTALIGSAGYLTWSQLREMSAAGMTIGSHGHQHIDHTGLSPAIAERELRTSCVELEDQLGVAATTFSAPYGFLNHALTSAARRAGFLHVCSSQPWVATSPTSVIPRLAIYNDTSLSEFASLAACSFLPLFKRRARTALLHLPKQLLLRTSPRKLGVNVHQEAK